MGGGEFGQPFPMLSRTFKRVNVQFWNFWTCPAIKRNWKKWEFNFLAKKFLVLFNFSYIKCTMWIGKVKKIFQGNFSFNLNTYSIKKTLYICWLMKVFCPYEVIWKEWGKGKVDSLVHHDHYRPVWGRQSGCTSLHDLLVENHQTV